jgi:hypothetical protein
MSADGLRLHLSHVRVPSNGPVLYELTVVIGEFTFAIDRSFSEFARLHRELIRRGCARRLPPLPPRKPAWFSRERLAVERFPALARYVAALDGNGLAMYAVAVQQFCELARAALFACGAHATPPPPQPAAFASAAATTVALVGATGMTNERRVAAGLERWRARRAAQAHEPFEPSASPDSSAHAAALVRDDSPLRSPHGACEWRQQAPPLQSFALSRVRAYDTDDIIGVPAALDIACADADDDAAVAVAFNATPLSALSGLSPSPGVRSRPGRWLAKQHSEQDLSGFDVDTPRCRSRLPLERVAAGSCNVDASAARERR